MKDTDLFEKCIMFLVGGLSVFVIALAALEWVKFLECGCK